MIRFRPSFQVDPYVALTYDGHQAGVVVERDGSSGPAGLVGLGLVELNEIVLRGRRTPVRPAPLAGRPPRCPPARHRALDRRLAALPGPARRSVTMPSSPPRSRRATPARSPPRPAGRRSSRVPSRPWRSAGDPRRRLGRLVHDQAGATGRSRGVRRRLRELPRRLRPVDPRRRRRPGRVARAFSRPVADAPNNALWVVEDAGGTLVAGLGTTEARRLTVLHVDALPTSIAPPQFGHPGDPEEPLDGDGPTEPGLVPTRRRARRQAAVRDDPLGGPPPGQRRHRDVRCAGTARRDGRARPGGCPGRPLRWRSGRRWSSAPTTRSTRSSRGAAGARDLGGHRAPLRDGSRGPVARPSLARPDRHRHARCARWRTSSSTRSWSSPGPTTWRSTAGSPTTPSTTGRRSPTSGASSSNGAAGWRSGRWMSCRTSGS